MLNLVLLVLTVLLVWETVRTVMPFRVPAVAHSGLVILIAYGCTYLPSQALLVASTASAVGLLHALVGTSDEHKQTLRLSLPRWTRGEVKRNRVPELPRG